MTQFSEEVQYLDACDPRISTEKYPQLKLMFCDKGKEVEDGVTLERGGANDAILEDPGDPSTRKDWKQRNWAEVSTINE